MGLRGPKPTPAAVLKARGTFRADRHHDSATAGGKPTCPAWLNKDAKREFRRLVKLLGEMGLLGAVDQNALARYSTTWLRWRQAVAMIERGGEVVVYKDEAGKVKAVHPSAFNSIARSLADELSRLEQAFGMNPSSRSRIAVDPPAPAATPEGKSRFFGDLN